jgi:peptide/nickel transport system permease protein
MAFNLQVANAITSEAGLSAIGLGPTDVLSLGQMLRWVIMWEAARYGAWWWFMAAGVPITLISLSVLLINDGLDEVYNPKIRRK